jgi:hypothetical protein
VGPGGAARPPESLTVRPAGPQAPHLVPPHERLMMRLSSGRGDAKCKRVSTAGDNFIPAVGIARLDRVIQ